MNGWIFISQAEFVIEPMFREQLTYYSHLMMKNRPPLFSIVVGVLALPFLIHLPSVKKLKTKPYESHATDQADQAKKDENPPPTKLLRPDEDTKAPKYRTTGSQNEEKPSKKGRLSDARMQALFTGLIFFVTSIYTYTSYRQLRIMEQTLNMVERPYVAVKEMSLSEVAVDQSPIADILFENAGRTPALNATFYVYLGLTEAFIPDDPAEYPSFSNVTSNAFMQTGGEQRVRAIANFVISEEALEKIKNNELKLSVYGSGEYDDALGNHQIFKFCRLYNHKEPSQIVVCPKHNIYK